jgi:hypothetical protein
MAGTTVIDGVDYGPLASLVGTWEGGKGMDVSPEPDGKEETPYYETLLFEAIGDVTNAGAQTLAVLLYHQIVTRQSDKQVFHNETGYWMWDGASNTVMQSLTIPRGVCLLAGGQVDLAEQGRDTELEVKAVSGDSSWGITQSPFMQENAKTTEFRHRISVSDGELVYSETTVLDIYGKIFEHTDANTLQRVD